MYFRSVLRPHPSTGELQDYYRLTDCYRNEFGRVCHKTLLNVGHTDLKAEQLNIIQRLLTARAEGKSEVFPADDSLISEWVEKFWTELIKKKKVDDPLVAAGKRKKLLYEDTLCHKDVKETGAEWICLNTLEWLKLREFFESLGWDDEQIRLTYTQLISRAVYPASELNTTQWIRENSAVCELTGYPAERITGDVLYKNAWRLWENKVSIENYLSKKTNELFGIEDKIVLYDLAHTYFEGEKRHSRLAQYGRPKEKLSDCQIIMLARVINPEGFIKYTHVFEGNTTDAPAVVAILDQLCAQSSHTATRATVVLDAGIATEANLQLLQDKGFDYVCVRRGNLKEYAAVNGSTPQITGTQNRKQLTVQRVSTSSTTDYILQVKSPGRELKEESMKNVFEARYEQAMEGVKLSLTREHAVRQAGKVNRSIRSVQEKYPSVAQYYDVEVKQNEKGQAIELNYHKCKEKYDAACGELGVYFVRTNKTMNDQAEVWSIYTLIREIESDFRTLKTDLDFPPVYHKREEATPAHLHLGLLAYWLMNTIRCQLKRKGIHIGWSELVRIANTQKVITTEAQNVADELVSIRRCSEPDEKLAVIYDILHIKPLPFTKRKSVVYKPASKK